jgi:hypothetical protein
MIIKLREQENGEAWSDEALAAVDGRRVEALLKLMLK